MKLSPRIIPGGLHTSNKSACDWGWQGLLAYGCQNFIVVLDTKTVQIIQTVHHYTSPIVKVKWAKENYHHDIHTPYNLRLAASDQASHVMILDINEGRVTSEFSEGGKVAIEMEWLKHHEVSHDLLMVLHSPGTLVLWNADTGVKLWKKAFVDPLLSFALDPFDGKTITVMSQEWIMFLKDFTTTSAPPDKGRKFYMTASMPAAASGVGATSSQGTPAKVGTSKSAFQKMRSWAGDIRGSGKTEYDENASCECLQVTYLPSSRNNFLLLFPREILILDLEIGLAIGSFAIEYNNPSFLQIIPCSQRDALFCLHDNGSITLRLRRSPNCIPYKTPDNLDAIMSNKVSVDIIYDAKCQSDVFRLSRLCRPMGFCINPLTECEVAVILSDGRVLIWDLVQYGSFKHLPLKTSNELPSTVKIQPTKNIVESNENLTLTDILPPLVTFQDPPEERKLPKMKFVLNGIYEGLSSNPLCIKMCPPLTTKNWAIYRPLMAVGSSSGIVQIFNLGDGSIYREFAVHATAVKGIEWIGLSCILSFAQSSSGSAKSEIQMVDIRTGQSHLLPTSRGLQESCITAIKVSYQKYRHKCLVDRLLSQGYRALRLEKSFKKFYDRYQDLIEKYQGQYFLILFKNHHVELWDATTLTQLREFPGNFPPVTAFDWSPLHYSAKLRKKHSPKAELLPSLAGSESTSTVLETSVQSETKQTQSFSKEHLVFTDSEGMVYHYVVEGTSMKDGSKVPPESGMGQVTYITWKTDLLVLGDVDGNINLWDLKAKVSRVFPSHRGAVKRMKFAPGKGNMKALVLFNDGIDVWEALEATIVYTLKTTKDQPSVVDADWLSSDMPALLLSDGSIRILDSAIKSCNSAIGDKSVEERVFLPRALKPKPAFTLKHLLQHQPWNQVYSLNVADQGDVQFLDKIRSSFESLPVEYEEKLYNCPLGTAERCCVVAQIFGDESEYLFWNVTLHYLQREQARRNCVRHKDESSKSRRRSGFTDVYYSDGTRGIERSGSNPNLDLLDSYEEVSGAEDQPGLEIYICSCMKASLDSRFDLICDNDYYQKLQSYRIALRDTRRATAEHTRTCAEKLILIGETDRAVQILLEADPTDNSYYADALRACLIATVRSSGASQSTIKLVATNLIANGKLTEGVELLCLVEKGVEACRYLQTYGDWELATWLAKVTLNQQDYVNVMMRWVDQLSSSHVNQKNKAILVLVSLGKFTRALEVMFSLGQTDRAVLFLEACLEFNLLSLNDETHSTLYENIFLEYARLLHKLGMSKAVEHYCNQAGGRGRKLLDELRAIKLKEKAHDSGSEKGESAAESS